MTYHRGYAVKKQNSTNGQRGITVDNGNGDAISFGWGPYPSTLSTILSRFPVQLLVLGIKKGGPGSLAGGGRTDGFAYGVKYPIVLIRLVGT